jgi:hypothetical protein
MGQDSATYTRGPFVRFMSVQLTQAIMHQAHAQIQTEI